MGMVMTTLAGLRSGVRELIGPGVYDRFFKPEWATEGLNFACDQCSALLGLTRVDCEYQITNKHVIIPDDAIKVVNVIRYLKIGEGEYAMGKVLLESTIQTEDTNRPNWRSITVGEPTVWIQASGSLILLNGIPSFPWVVVGYIQRPTAMVNDSDAPDVRIPEIFHQYLKYGAANYLLTLSGQAQDMEKAGQMFAKFAAGLGVAPLPLASKDVKR